MEPNDTALCAQLSDASPALLGGGRMRIMWMPGGRHQPQLKTEHGVPLTVDVECKPEDAAKIQGTFEALCAAEHPRRPFCDLDHDNKTATLWPEKFTWSETPQPGIYLEGEASTEGLQAVEGKTRRGFSPTFFVDSLAGKPARLLPKLRMVLGGFTNRPAFTHSLPLFASESDPSSAAVAAVAANKTKNTSSHIMTPEEQAAAASKAAQEALLASQAETKKLQETLTARNRADAKREVKLAVQRRALPAQDTALHASWEEKLTADPTNIVLLASIPDGPDLTKTIVDPAKASGASGAQAGFSVKGAMNKMLKLVALNAKESWMEGKNEKKSALAREASALYATELKPHLNEWLDMPLREAALEAASDLDNIGTLAGTLVLLRTLPLFAYTYPAIGRIWQDFSDTPGLYNQTENTRIITSASVQTFDYTTTNGYPNGWTTAVTGTTTDVAVTLNTHVGIPLVFGQDTLAATNRRLFEEQGPASMNALGAYAMTLFMAQLTAAKYNSFAAATADGTVPDAYPTYPVALKDFGMGAIDDIGSAFDAIKVPATDRSIIIAPKYYRKLKRDPALALYWAALNKPDIITKGELPELDMTLPIKAPWLTAGGANRIGFMFHKSALIIKARPPLNLQSTTGVQFPGSITTVTDPETGITVLLVQYIDPKGSYAAWRIEVLLGVAVGDKRGGMLLTSQ